MLTHIRMHTHTYLNTGSDDDEDDPDDDEGGGTGGDNDEDGDTIMARQKRWGDSNIENTLKRYVGDMAANGHSCVEMHVHDLIIGYMQVFLVNTVGQKRTCDRYTD
jgi:hypothetical protein